jgi:hypothetical protein
MNSLRLSFTASNSVSCGVLDALDELGTVLSSTENILVLAQIQSAYINQGIAPPNADAHVSRGAK